MDFQSLREDILTKHKHLNSMTVGKFIAMKTVPSIIESIKKEHKVDVDKLNELWREKAKEGANALVKELCPRCNTTKRGKAAKMFLVCKNCKINVFSVVNLTKTSIIQLKVLITTNIESV